MATVKQKKAIAKVVENGGNVSKAMVDAGYSAATAKTPQKLTESKGWDELMGDLLSDKKLIEKHDSLLNSTRLDHMLFPLGPRTEKEKKTVDALPENLKTLLDADLQLMETELSDDDIRSMLEEVNCKVRRIVHGQSARHVYFWSADNKARKEALDMAYKLKGKYAPEKRHVVVEENSPLSRADEEVLTLLNATYRNPQSEAPEADGVSAHSVDTQAQD